MEYPIDPLGEVYLLSKFDFSTISHKIFGTNSIFMWDSALREGFNCYFSDFFASIRKFFISAGGLGTGLSIEFIHFPNVS